MPHSHNIHILLGNIAEQNISHIKEYIIKYGDEYIDTDGRKASDFLQLLLWNDDGHFYSAKKKAKKKNVFISGIEDDYHTELVKCENQPAEMDKDGMLYFFRKLFNGTVNMQTPGDGKLHVCIHVPTYDSAYLEKAESIIDAIEDSGKTYTVDFVGMDGQVIKSQTVASGANATAPTPPTVKGYKFVGWSGSYTNITTDTTVTAEYDIVHNQLFFSMTDNGDGTVTVTLSLEGDVNLYGLECKIYLETEGMEYTSLKSVATGLMANKKSDHIILSYATADGCDVTEPHTLLSVTFTKVAEDVSVSASISDVDAFDQSFVSESYSVADDFCG